MCSFFFLSFFFRGGGGFTGTGGIGGWSSGSVVGPGGTTFPYPSCMDTDRFFFVTALPIPEIQGYVGQDGELAS